MSDQDTGGVAESWDEVSDVISQLVQCVASHTLRLVAVSIAPVTRGQDGVRVRVELSWYCVVDTLLCVVCSVTITRCHWEYSCCFMVYHTNFCLYTFDQFDQGFWFLTVWRGDILED